MAASIAIPLYTSFFIFVPTMHLCIVDIYEKVSLKDIHSHYIEYDHEEANYGFSKKNCTL